MLLFCRKYAKKIFFLKDELEFNEKIRSICVPFQPNFARESDFNILDWQENYSALQLREYA